MPRRAQVNPLDKSTIVSVYPREVHVRNHTLTPGKFDIEPGYPDKPSLLVIGSSSWFKDYDPDQPYVEIPVGSMMIAESIVNDYINGMLCCDMAELRPGLFWVVGEVAISEFIIPKSRYWAALQQAIQRQRNWFQELVRQADVLWARTSGNPRSVTDDMKLAARELNLAEMKDWTKDDAMVAEMVRCSACGSLRNSKYPICPTCKTNHSESSKAS